MTSTPQFQLMPPLSADEQAELEKSIIEHGVILPIVVDEDGNIIDGHHREKIANSLGLECKRDIRSGFTDAEKRAMALTLNIDRRHLTQQQKRELLKTSITADPELSDREHGRRTGTDNKTAAKVRAELEGREEIPHTEKRTDKVGRKQPASKPNLTVVDPEPEANIRPKSGDFTAAVAPLRDLVQRTGSVAKSITRMLTDVPSAPERKDFQRRLVARLEKLVGNFAPVMAKLTPAQRDQIVAALLAAVDTA